MIARCLLFIVFLPLSLWSQEFSKLENFKSELKKNISEEKRFALQQNLIDIYRIYNPDSCLFYTQKNLALIKRDGWNSRKGKTLLGLASYYTEKNSTALAYRYNKESSAINLKTKTNMSWPTTIICSAGWPTRKENTQKRSGII
uniref:Uncharacterized protein n=1 Tax=Chryseobacterium endophyticum TaxID=1854762 RepID=A0AAU6WQE6_9FLAO